MQTMHTSKVSTKQDLDRSIKKAESSLNVSEITYNQSENLVEPEIKENKSGYMSQ